MTSTITFHANSTRTTTLPQIDGHIDYDHDDYLTCLSIIDFLIEQIVIENNQFLLNDNEHSINLSSCLTSKTITSKIESISSEQLINLYQKWLKSKYGHITFTITSNDGYKIISDNLDLISFLSAFMLFNCLFLLVLSIY